MTDCSTAMRAEQVGVKTGFYGPVKQWVRFGLLFRFRCAFILFWNTCQVFFLV